MSEPLQQGGRKLVKRRPLSQSPSRERGVSGNRFSQQDTPAVPPLESSVVEPPSSTMPPKNESAADKEKRSKWRLSNPFHSKDKQQRKDSEAPADVTAAEPSTRATTDSAYFSSEHMNSSVSDLNTSNPTSFTSTSRRNSRGEQLRPAATNLQAPPNTAPTTNITPPTPPVHSAYEPPAQPAAPSSVGHSLAHSHSAENIQRNSYEDHRTGNVVTTVTTTTTTTTTTSGPGGSTTFEQPNNSSANSTTEGHVTNTSGPSPPSPAPPARAQQPPHHAAPIGPPKPQPSPPIPNRNNMRNRVELDSVSPGIEAPNPLASPVSPPSPARHNFSYPARAPPPGVPRQVPVQPPLPGQQSIPGHQSIPGQQSNTGEHLQQHQAPHNVGYGDSSIPAALVPGHHPSHSQTQPQAQPQTQGPQKHATLANLKLAAAGIHGAGEALRGTLNSSVDKRFANPNSTVHAKNQAAIDAGRSEIETGHLVHGQRTNAHANPHTPAASKATPQYGPQYGSQQAPGNPAYGSQQATGFPAYGSEQVPGTPAYGSQQAPGKAPYSGPPVPGSQIEPRTGGKLNSFMKKMKEGPAASSERSDGRNGGLKVVNE